MKRSFTALVLATVWAWAPTDATYAGLTQWKISEGGNGHWYDVVVAPSEISWTTAKNQAIAAGGHLATITSAAESNWVFEHVVDDPSYWWNSFGPQYGPWIGGYQDVDAPDYSVPTGAWRWVTGEPWSYTNWRTPGEPNDGHLCCNEDALHYASVGQRASTWNDFPNNAPDITPGVYDKPFAYVIERDPPGTPPEPIPGITEHPLQPAPGSTARNAIIMVHGLNAGPWKYKTDGAPSDTDPRSTNMKGNLEKVVTDDWDVLVFDWKEDALQEGFLPWFPWDETAEAAVIQGRFLASEIRRLGYSHVHLVGHSLGGLVIESTTTGLKGDDIGIHATYLDAFALPKWELLFGKNANWAEHYYHDEGIEESIMQTAGQFKNAHNVDITALQDEWCSGGLTTGPTRRHSLPLRWYDDTISNGQNDNYGFVLSKEAGTGNWPPELELGVTVKLPLAGEPSVHPGVATSNIHSIDPAASLVNVSETGTVNVSDDTISMETGSPVWGNFLLTTEGVTNYLEFDFDFTSDADGVLSVFLDNELLGTFYERFAAPGIQESGELFFEDDLEAGFHVLAFRVDPLTDSTSFVTLSGIEAGYLTVVPEPSTFVLLAMGALGLLVVARRKRR